METIWATQKPRFHAGSIGATVIKVQPFTVMLFQYNLKQVKRGNSEDGEEVGI